MLEMGPLQGEWRLPTASAAAVTGGRKRGGTESILVISNLLKMNNHLDLLYLFFHFPDLDSQTTDHEVVKLLVKFTNNIPTVFHHEATMCLVHRNNLEGITNIIDERLQRK